MISLLQTRNKFVTPKVNLFQTKNNTKSLPIRAGSLSLQSQVASSSFKTPTVNPASSQKRFFSTFFKRFAAEKATQGAKMEKNKTQPSIPLSHNAAFFATSSVPPPGAETPPASTTTTVVPSSGIRWDLGLRSLLPVWKSFGQKKWLVEDFSAGLALSFVAVPLSLAISVASGVSPGVGLVTAIVGGVLGGAFGGTTLAVTGPAAAMSVLVATTIANYGMGGLIFITMVTGLLQILTGVFQIGNLVRIIPQSVVAGFSAGVGGLIFLGQLPRVLGLPPVSSEATALESLFHILHFLPQAQLAPVVLALVAMGISMVLPKFTNRVPGLVVGVAAAALINSFFGLGQPVLGTIDASLPLPSFPSMPQVNDWMALIGTSAAIYGLASLESLLSSSVVDKLCKDPDVPKHDPNQELIGQGMANVGSSLVGGMPVTSVIARSALNVTTGGKSRRSAIIHSILIFGFVSFFSDVLAAIPMAALSGVLLTVAFRLLHPREAIHIYHVSKKKMVPFLVTFVVTLAKNLIVGVECGVVAAVAMSLMQGRPRFLSFNQSRRDGAEVFQLQGDLTFLSAIRFQAFEDRVFSLFASLPSPSLSPSSSSTPSSSDERVIEVDLSQVRLIDLTGAELFIEFLRKLLGKNIPGKNVLVTGLSPSLQTTLKNSTTEVPLLFVLNNTNTAAANA